MKRFGIIFFVFTSLALSCASIGFADEEKVEVLEPIKVEATRQSLEEKDIPASITVIDREEIVRKKYINVEDMLREELGLDVVQNGALGSTATVFMRGAGSSSTLGCRTRRSSKRSGGAGLPTS